MSAQTKAPTWQLPVALQHSRRGQRFPAVGGSPQMETPWAPQAWRPLPTLL